VSRLRLPAVARDGRVHFPDWAMKEYQEWCRAHEGKRATVEVSPGDPTRSLAQNSLWWGVIIRKGFVRATGETSEDWWHAHLKERFCRIAVLNSKGETIWTTEDTSRMTVARFSEKIDLAIAYLADEFHYGIPEEDHVLYEEAQGIKRAG
jgi:hypothetical protein